MLFRSTSPCCPLSNFSSASSILMPDKCILLLITDLMPTIWSYSQSLNLNAQTNWNFVAYAAIAQFRADLLLTAAINLFLSCIVTFTLTISSWALSWLLFLGVRCAPDCNPKTFLQFPLARRSYFLGYFTTKITNCGHYVTVIIIRKSFRRRMRCTGLIFSCLKFTHKHTSTVQVQK